MTGCSGSSSQANPTERAMAAREPDRAEIKREAEKAAAQREAEKADAKQRKADKAEAQRKAEKAEAKAKADAKKESEAKKAADAVKAKFMDGSFVIFKGPLKDNTGKELIPAGKSFEQTAIELESMDYLVEGVIGQ